MSGRAACTLLLLAGGQSRRLGRDKTRLRRGGRPLMAELLERYAGLYTRALVCTVAEGAAPPPGAAGIATVADNWPGCGPLAGIEAGLAAMDTPWALALACDMPDVPRAVPEALLAAAARDPEARCVVPEHDGKLEPLCALYHRDCLPAARRLLEAGQLRVRGLFQAMPTVTVPAGPVFFNINLPRDLERFEKKKDK